MMLPILISVSLAPGSYFFWALASLAIATAASDIRATRLVLRNCMLFLPAFPQVGQGTRGLARTGLFRAMKQAVVAGAQLWSVAENLIASRLSLWKHNPFVSGRAIPDLALQPFAFSADSFARSSAASTRSTPSLPK